MTILRMLSEGGTFRYTVAWLDENNQRLEAEYDGLELVRVSIS
jgi:hypothetical protein